MNALKDVFIGASVERESGYINLTPKARYFEQGVFLQVIRDVEAVLQAFRIPWRTV